MKLFDTATGTVKPLAQRERGKVSIYACGPTVYDLPHVGHGRMALNYDILRRYLESRGIEVHHVSNITDIEDKIIDRAAQLGVEPSVITEQYEAAWWEAIDKLNVLRPHDAPHATEYVDKMISMIEDLRAAGFAYETSDSIYFEAGKVADYGIFAKQSIESLQAGARVEQDEEKRSPIDFALWKKVDPDSPHWDSPWGPGRPGWHTECVVMSLDLLGDGFDLHTGGIDLMFPHHENERAQAVAWGRPFAQHWMHNGFVEVAGEKMSKSLGNFTTLTDLLDRTDPRACRLLVLRAHYRSPIEVTPENIADAETAMARLDDFARRFTDTADVDPDPQMMARFVDSMDDDLDSPRAVAGLFEAVREAHFDADAGLTEQAERKARAAMVMCEIFGLLLRVPNEEIDSETADLIRQRDEARNSKDWAHADSLRDHLQMLGWTVEDTPSGTKVHR